MKLRFFIQIGHVERKTNRAARDGSERLGYLSDDIKLSRRQQPPI